MNTNFAYGLYGNPSHTLLLGDAEAIQLSPLVIGSHLLKAQPAESLHSITIAAPAGTLDRRYVFAAALNALAPDGEMLALGLQNKGGKRIAVELEAFGCVVTETSRNHYRLCTTRRPASLHGIAEALNAGGPQIHPSHGLWTQPGIFSWDRVDSGSALLLKHLPTLSGRGADLGCGLGILAAAALASPDVNHITLVDMDRRAVAMAERNITDPRAAFIWGDARDALPLAELDFVVMNPPFHEGGLEDKTLGQAFITRAAQLLKRGGVCWLTANRHLPYEALLDGRFTRHRLVVQADGFKIYMAEK